MKLETKKRNIKTKCHNCIGNVHFLHVAKELVFNIRACTNTRCTSWQHRAYKQATT